MKFTRYVPFRKGTNWFIVDRLYNSIISKKLDYAYFIDYTLKKSSSIVIRRNDKYAIITSINDLQSINWFSELKAVLKGGPIYLAYDDFNWSILDWFGNKKTTNTYEKIIHEGYVNHSIILVIKSGKYGVLDLKTFQPVLECKYDIIKSNTHRYGDLVLTMFKGSRCIVYNCNRRDFMKLPHFDKIAWCSENICCLIIDEKVYLYNFTKCILVTNIGFDSADLFIDGYSICAKNKFLYAVFENGEKISLAPISNSFTFIRQRDILILTTSIKSNKSRNNDLYSFHIFKQLKYCKSLDYETHRKAYAGINNNLLEILEISKYGSTIVKTFNLNDTEKPGNSLQDPKQNWHYSDSPAKHRHSNNYKISDNKLYFNNRLVFDKHSGELHIEEINDIIRLKVILDVDPESGVLEEIIGYLDQFGNRLWEDIFPVCCNCQVSTDVIGDWDKYKCNNCNHKIDNEGNCITENCRSCNEIDEYEDEAEMESIEYPVCAHCGDSNDVSDPGGSYYWCSHCKHDIDTEGNCALPNCETCNQEIGDDEECLFIEPKCKNCGDENDIIVLKNDEYYCTYCKKALIPIFAINSNPTSSTKKPLILNIDGRQEYYLFIDTETTGLATDINASASDTANWPRLVQIAWVVFDTSGRLLDRQVRVVKPTQFIIPEMAIKIHGISNEYANRYGINITSVLEEISTWLEKANVLIGHNIKFDYNVLKAEFIRNRLHVPNNDVKLICTMEIGADICKIKCLSGYKYPKLSELYVKLFQSEFTNNHDALADVDATARCFLETKRAEDSVVKLIPKKKKPHTKAMYRVRL